MFSQEEWIKTTVCLVGAVQTGGECNMPGLGSGRDHFLARNLGFSLCVVFL